MSTAVLPAPSPAPPPIPLLNPATLNPALKPVVVRDAAGLAQVADYISRVTEFAIDTETNVVPTFIDRKIRTIQLGDKNEQYVIDLLAFAGSTEALMPAGLETDACLGAAHC
jgi:hypothetical protein